MSIFGKFFILACFSQNFTQLWRSRLEYILFRRWCFYMEAGLAKQDIQISLYTSALKVEYKETELTFYTIVWHKDNMHIMVVSNPRVIETSYRSLQLTLWTLSLMSGCSENALPDDAPRTRRKTIDGDVIQLSFPESDEDQHQAL